MKRIRVLLLILLCLLPAGCSLRNRTDSAQFIPEHPETRQTETELQTTAAPETGAEYVDPAGRVKVLLNESGTFRYDAEPISYSYQIPMFDLPGAHAADCNQEIDARFGTPARDSLDTMKTYHAPEVETVAFQSYEFGGILTVQVDRKDVDGSVYQGVYSVNAETGDLPTVEEFLRAAGLEDRRLWELLSDAVQNHFTRNYSEAAASADNRYTSALTRTLTEANETDASRLHLTPDGGLSALVLISVPAGGSEWIELPLS